VGYTPVQAVATSSLAIVFTSIAGTLQNWRMGYLDRKQIIVFGIPALITAQLGVYLANRLPSYLLLFLLGVTFLINRYLLQISNRSKDKDQFHELELELNRPIHRNSLLLRLSIGGASGLFSGLFGIGAGSILVPFQILLLGEKIKVAIQTSLGVIVGTALSSTLGHTTSGNILLFEGVILGLGGVVGSQFSTRLLPKLPESLVRKIYRGYLAILSIYLFWQSWLKTNPQTFLLTLIATGIIGVIGIGIWVISKFLVMAVRTTTEFASIPTRLSKRTFGWIRALLIVLMLQTLALGWAYRGDLNQTSTAFQNSFNAITQDLNRQRGSECNVPSSGAPVNSSYVQICTAMQDVLNVPSGQFFYGGTMGAAALRSPGFMKEINVAHPNFRLRYLDPLSVPPDSATGIKMLMRGDISFAESQRPLSDEEYLLAQSRGFKLRQIPIATTAATFYTHPNLRLPGLAVDQVQAIYTGQITNWQEVGGPDLPIVPVSQDTSAAGSTLSLLMQDLPPEQQQLGENVEIVRDTTAAIRKVSHIEGAIGFGTQAVTVQQQTIRPLALAKWQSVNYISPITANGEINKDVLRDGSYPLLQRIFVIVRQDNSLDETAGTAYANLLLSEKGQELVNQAGYLPIRLQNRSS
jgi:phosphate transport system substrate-binding protein